MQIALLNGAAEAALAQYEVQVSSLDGLKESDLQGKPCRDKEAQVERKTWILDK